MNASDLMTRHVLTVSIGTPIADAIRLMLSQHVSGLPVVDALGRPAGLITEGDLLRRAELGTERQRSAWLEFIRGPGRQAAEFVQTHARKVDDVMTRELVTVEEDTPAETVVTLMQEHGIKRVPVLRDGQLVGLISRADLLRALLPNLAPCSAQASSDDEIRSRVEAAVAGERWVPRDGIKVSCNCGSVTLAGVIFDERERDALRVLAEAIPGVKSVRDELVWVDPMSGMTLSDEVVGAP